MATNFTNSQTGSLVGATSNTIPASTTLAGTIETVGKAVIGTGTTFTTQLKKGDYISSLAAGEIRQITSVAINGGDTSAFIDRPFTTDLPAGSALVVTPRSRIREIRLETVAGGGNITVNGVGGIPPGRELVYERPQTAQYGGDKDYVDPIVVTVPAATTVIYTLQY